MKNSILPAAFQPYGFVNTGKDPGGPVYRKIIIPIAGLPITQPGQEFNLGIAGEVKIFADFPIFIRLGDAPVNAEQRLSEVSFIGRVGSVFLRRATVADVGRVVIYIGVPTLGVNWSRENPELRQPRADSVPFPTVVWGFGTTFVSALTISSMPLNIEAQYLVSVSLVRSGGSIERIQYIESETGILVPLINHRFENPSDRVTFRPAPYHRIAANGAFVIHGSNEPGNTNLTIEVMWVTV